jgi:2-methylisocitrate lyase-like PEP mutase family enzyme
MPFDDLLMLLKRIVNAVNVPVTADIESGYAENKNQLEKNIKQLIATGIIGINIEDSDKKTKTLLPVGTQCERIMLIKKVAEEMNRTLFINARTDVYIYKKAFDRPESIIEETIKRGEAYKLAGADCFYPITMQKEEDIRETIARLQMPVNILLMPGIPELKVLQEIGVSRISLGPGFLKIAVKAMKDLAIKLRQKEGISDIAGNEITSDYIKGLINRRS